MAIRSLEKGYLPAVPFALVTYASTWVFLNLWRSAITKAYPRQVCSQHSLPTMGPTALLSCRHRALTNLLTAADCMQAQLMLTTSLSPGASCLSAWYLHFQGCCQVMVKPQLAMVMPRLRTAVRWRWSQRWDNLCHPLSTWLQLVSATACKPSFLSFCSPTMLCRSAKKPGGQPLDRATLLSSCSC